MSEFLHMGGYAVYVWSSYVLALAVVVINLWWPLQHERAVRQRLQRRWRRDAMTGGGR